MQEDKIEDILFCRYFRLLFKQNLAKYHGDCALSFCHALIESSRAKIKDKRAYKEWAQKYSRCISYKGEDSHAA